MLPGGRGVPPPVPGRGAPVAAPEEEEEEEHEGGYKWGSVADRKDTAFNASLADKKNPKAAPAKPVGPAKPTQPLGYSGVGPWNCDKCRSENPEAAATCALCGNVKPDPVIEGPWECRSCRTKNKEQLLKCSMCGGDKPDPTAAPKPKGPAYDPIKEAYNYVPQVIAAKKEVDPNDPFADVELVEW